MPHDGRGATPIPSDRRAPRRIGRPSRLDPEGRALFGARFVASLDRGSATLFARLPPIIRKALRRSPAPRVKQALKRDVAAGGIYRSTKTYDHNEGLSCTFRQWRAEHSHCRLLHGYAFAFKFVFATRDLDDRNWCFDFGGMKPVRQWLHHMFDHTLLVAMDDPERERLEALGAAALADVRILPAVGCEAMARFVHAQAGDLLRDAMGGRVWLESVEVREHGGNSALYSLD